MKTFTISLANLSAPRDICYLLEKRGVKYFTYSFQCNDGIIKHGKAADKEWQSGTWGNRVYRQAGGIPGWGAMALADTSALKMNVQMNKHFPGLTRADVTITICDFTAELQHESDAEIDRVLLNEEDAMVKRHIADYGAPPKLNIQKTKTRTKPILSSALFEVE